MTNEVVVSRQRLKKYLCACGKAYNRPSLLEEHQRTHTGEQPFKCDLCEARFSRRSILQKHVLKHVSPEEKPFKCPECGKGVNTQQHLDQHMGLHNRPFNCSHENCDETFRYEVQLKRHLIRHKRTCCGTVFPTQQKYLTHVERNHSKKYNCGVCADSFDKFPELQKHISSTHKADSAKRAASTLSSGEQNEESASAEPKKEVAVDEGTPKPVKKRKIGPTISRITGVGYEERPLACLDATCDKRFFRQYDLNRHMVAAHGKAETPATSTPTPTSEVD